MPNLAEPSRPVHSHPQHRCSSAPSRRASHCLAGVWGGDALRGSGRHTCGMCRACLSGSAALMRAPAARSPICKLALGALLARSSTAVAASARSGNIHGIPHARRRVIISTLRTCECTPSRSPRSAPCRSCTPALGGRFKLRGGEGEDAVWKHVCVCEGEVCEEEAHGMGYTRAMHMAMRDA